MQPETLNRSIQPTPTVHPRGFTPVEARLNVFKREPEPAGTMIMSFKLTIGKIAKLGIRAFHNEAIISIWSGVAELDSFLFRVLPDLARNATAKGAVKGATLNRQSLARIMVPLPPLPEQRRIVAKVDELMALCDRLEEARAAREDTRDRLTKASLARLSAPGTDVPAFRSHARFAVDALPALTARTDQVKHLRQTILNLAVRGKLVGHDPADEPALELLKRIAIAKSELKQKTGTLVLGQLTIPTEKTIQYPCRAAGKCSLSRTYFSLSTIAVRPRQKRMLVFL